MLLSKIKYNIGEFDQLLRMVYTQLNMQLFSKNQILLEIGTYLNYLILKESFFMIFHEIS